MWRHLRRAYRRFDRWLLRRMLADHRPNFDIPDDPYCITCLEPWPCRRRLQLEEETP